MKIITDLTRTRDQTLDYFNLPESRLKLTYAPGKWNIKQILNHLTDAESVLYDRIRRCIANPNQVVWGYDQDKWALELNYLETPLTMNKALFTAVRDAIIYQAGQHYTDKGLHRINHSGDGPKTLRDIFDKVVWHSQNHLLQIESALAQKPF